MHLCTCYDNIYVGPTTGPDNCLVALEAGQAAHSATAPAAVYAEPHRESVSTDHTAAAAEEREKLAALRRRTAAAAAAEARAESQGSSNDKDD